jgi:hypothetical protein
VQNCPGKSLNQTLAFKELVVHTLNKAGINLPDRLQGAQNLPEWNEAPDSRPPIVDAQEDKIVYEITFDLTDAGLADNVVPPDNNVPSLCQMLPCQT